jgi:hypothetical protein
MRRIRYPRGYQKLRIGQILHVNCSIADLRRVCAELVWRIETLTGHAG